MVPPATERLWIRITSPLHLEVGDVAITPHLLRHLLAHSFIHLLCIAVRCVALPSQHTSPHSGTAEKLLRSGVITQSGINLFKDRAREVRQRLDLL